MAVLKKRYSDINDTLKHIRLQIEESKPFAASFVPKCKSPTDLFFYLKPYLKYKHDPKGIELLQSMPTLIKNNYYGVSGCGDCDCFSIAAVASCLVQNWKNCEMWIKLAGRNKYTPVHIWSGVTKDGKDYAMDLTNPIPNYERNYPYIQKLYLKKKVINK